MKKVNSHLASHKITNMYRLRNKLLSQKETLKILEETHAGCCSCYNSPTHDELAYKLITAQYDKYMKGE